MTKRERCAAPEVFGALAGFMHGEPVFKVIGDARVKRIVSAAQDVDSPGHVTILTSLNRQGKIYPAIASSQMASCSSSSLAIFWYWVCVSAVFLPLV